MTALLTLKAIWRLWLYAAAKPFTPTHLMHLQTNVSWNNCDECRADNERSFLRPQWTTYEFVHLYLEWARPRLAALRDGENSVNARIWRNDFRRALNRRITLKGRAETGRKYCDSYLQRLRQFPYRLNVDRPLNPSTPVCGSAFLESYAKRRASTLS